MIRKILEVAFSDQVLVTVLHVDHRGIVLKQSDLSIGCDATAGRDLRRQGPSDFVPPRNHFLERALGKGRNCAAFSTRTRLATFSFGKPPLGHDARASNLVTKLLKPLLDSVVAVV